jgi:hypothetical protein
MAAEQGVWHRRRVAGVTPGKRGQDAEGIPVFNTVAMPREGGREHEPHLVPARLAADAIHEAIDAGIETPRPGDSSQTEFTCRQRNATKITGFRPSRTPPIR